MNKPPAEEELFILSIIGRVLNGAASLCAGAGSCADCSREILAFKERIEENFLKEIYPPETKRGGANEP